MIFAEFMSERITFYFSLVMHANTEEFLSRLYLMNNGNKQTLGYLIVGGLF